MDYIVHKLILFRSLPRQLAKLILANTCLNVQNLKVGVELIKNIYSTWGKAHNEILF